ncbi:sodium:proton antiporter, partial [Alphaproteobacteria bacterium]|nr:sodium:proton antiporter [Alphaproteobacteria bacterium]
TIIFFDLIFPQSKIGASINGKFLNIDFHEVVMEGALCFLLFAGALHIDFNLLVKKRYAILSLATLSIIISTILIGLGIFYIGQFIGLNIPIIFSLLFGALISPTDPVAVLSLLKSMKNVPDTLRVKIAGESLFNDGVGIVLFAVILNIAISSSTNTGIDLNYIQVLEFFFLETFGGITLGLITGFIAYKALKKIDDYALEVLITLSLVMGTYTIALMLHVSGPLAVVIAGLLIGNFATRMAMSPTTRNYLNIFWLIIDEILNAGLFILIGIEVMSLTFSNLNILAALIAIPLVLLARIISVSIPISILGLKRDFTKGAIPILTWGGMKGAISVALALSIPDIPIREPILFMTYSVVMFSIVIQGLSIKKLIGLVLK